MSLDPDFEEMRRQGHRAIDLAVAHLADLRSRRVITPPVAAELAPLLAEPLPRQPAGMDATLDRFFTAILPRATLVNHPRFFAYIPGPGSFAGAIGEWVAAATNPFVGTWLGGAALAQLEVQTLEWLREATGLPTGMTGIVTTGGSMANLGGLAAGIGDRDRTRAVVYTSQQAHYSLAKAAKVLGIPATQVRAIATDSTLRLDITALAAAIAADRADGLLPAVVAANAGTTNTGAIDPLPAIADLCARERLWLHVDAAYGGAIALLPTHRPLLAGWERADSVTFDPHKWFYAPFECGCLLVRDDARLAKAFGGDAEYMQDIPRRETNFFTRGPELTRGARALKLWFLLRAVGVDAIAAHVRADLDHCRLAHELLQTDPRIEIVTPPQLSIFTFALRAGEDAGRRLVDDLMREGFAMLSSTRLHGRFAIRFCVVNHRTSASDIRDSIDAIRAQIDATSGV
ncbi:MAG: aminotransferase class V-fold PLP-dependent enzyme [Planctomycetes bacterium]|nr:aminotransferase class V-fold PLP-dependent enzyme [Planctomycetota bacterium]